jgi:hypothetical protein
MISIVMGTVFFVLASLSVSVFFVKLELVAKDVVEAAVESPAPAVREFRNGRKGLVIW